MSNPPLNTIYGTSEPKQDGKLTGLVDVAGVEHLAYTTARRTLCLERFADQCSLTRPVTSACATCTHVREQMKRARCTDAKTTHLRAGAVRLKISRLLRSSNDPNATR